jgi:hypothetical protein
MTMDDTDPEVLAVRIKSLEDWRVKQEETQSRIIWTVLGTAALLILEPMKRILFGGGQ